MSQKELKDYFQWFMNALPQRINELAGAVRQSPGFETWQPDFTPASLDTLGKWFASQIETRNRTQEELQGIKDRLVFPMEIPNEELTERTFSVAIDVGMYFSQVLLKNYPTLKWEQPFGNKKFADYGQPLITGFGPVSVNPVRIGHVIAYGLAKKTYTSGRLREIYDIWSKKVQPPS